MRRVAATRESLVLAEDGIDPERLGGSLMARAVVPCVVGLSAPMLLALLIDPALLRHPQFVITVVLIPLLMGATAIYTYCVLVPGNVCGLVADPESRKVHVIHANLFATRTVVLPFEAITAIHSVSSYDRDGYGERRVELVTRRNERFLLPEGLSQTEVAELKRMLGRA